MEKSPSQEGQIDKELKHLKEEIEHEQGEIKHLNEELQHEQKELDHLKEEFKEIEETHHSRDHHHEKTVCLNFVVNGKPWEVNAKNDWPLKKAVEIALKESGNEGRPLTDWSVKWHNKTLDMGKEIKEYDLPECAELFLSLNAGQGG